MTMKWIKILQIQDLRKQIAFTLMMLVVCRIGAYIPVPGINGSEVEKAFHAIVGGGQNLLQLLDMFTGGAFAHMTITALGVVPYISASIIMQLLIALIPSMQRELRESGGQGRRKLGKRIRFLTLLLALFQSAFFAKQALYYNHSFPGIIFHQILDVQIFSVPWLFFLLVMCTMTTGTLFLMWIGEQISEYGIGNGISMIIVLGILISFPSMVGSIFKQLNLDSQDSGQITFSSLILLLGCFFVIILGTISVVQGVRKIPLQYARRGISDFHQLEDAHIPLKVNYAGVIPVIFASSLLMFPATLIQFLGKTRENPEGILSKISSMLLPGSWMYAFIYILLIIFFTYFWTATQFHPDQIASDMKKNGAFIPGIRQGKPTEEYLEFCMNRLTFIGGGVLALIAILPTLVSKILSVDYMISHFFGGTSLLILIGVIVDTTKQVVSNVMAVSCDGFMMKDGSNTLRKSPFF